jgi:phosphoribosyl-ATP pyrophosphohydrolase
VLHVFSNSENLPWQGAVSNLEGMKSFNELYSELSQIAIDRPAGSSSAALLDAGVHAIGKKIVEEAAEVWMAAEYESIEDLALEASQLIYHLQLLLVAKGVSLTEVEKVL